MHKRLSQFSALSSTDKLLFLRAWLMLGWLRIALMCVSFKQLSASLTHHRQKPATTRLCAEQVHLATHIGGMVARAGRFTPWQSSCLAQVMVAQRLLARRGIPGQFYLGVSRGNALRADPTLPVAHAWLQCDNKIVNGAAGRERFAIVSTFSWGEAA